MADEQYRWLDRETAERLLSGEPLEAVDAAARDQVEQLAATLGALSAPPPLTSAEIPGEAAALAAFHKVRAERGAVSAPVGRRAAGSATDGAVGAVVHLDRRGGRDGRPRRFRSARLGLAATLTVGMIGGVAVAAGTGALTTPFHVNEPEPAASVSAAATTEQPLVSPSPDDSAHGKGTPGGTPSGAAPGTGGGTRDEADGDGPAAEPGTTPAEEERNTAAAAERVERITSACRDLQDGKELSADRKRVLETAAGSATQVRKYCDGVLADADAAEREAGEQGEGDTGTGGSGQGGTGGQDDRSGSDEQGGNGGEDDPAGIAPGTDRQADGTALPTDSVVPTSTTVPSEPAQSPTPSATL